MTLLEELKVIQDDNVEAVKEILARHAVEVSEPILNDAFTWAAGRGHLKIVKYLLTLDNPKVDYKADEDFAFRCAAGGGHLEMVKYLLTLDNPKVDYRAIDDWAFRFAAEWGHLNVINHLLTLPNTDPSTNDFEAVVWAIDRPHIPIFPRETELDDNQLAVVESIAHWVDARGTDAQRARLNGVLGSRGIVVYGVLGNTATEINYEHSTHAASVHKSVSESATRLMTRYSEEIKGHKLHAVLESMMTYVNSLPSSTVATDAASAAQRYLAGEPTEDYPEFAGNVSNPREGSRFLFKDPGSGLTTQQVLALTYLAALDDEIHPLTSPQDALEHVVRGLYEARRGYNLNDKNEDDGLADNMICAPGAFNKAIEALATIHPDCEIVLVTKAQASMKLPKVVEAEAYAYLHHQLQQTQSSQEIDDFKVLLAKVKDEGISVILPDISNNVAKVMFEEFGSLYSDDIQNANFQALIGTAEYIGLDDSKLDALKLRADGYSHRKREEGGVSAASSVFGVQKEEDAPRTKTFKK